MERAQRLYSYVVEHDNGKAPNPYFGVCTLCRCKFRKSLRKPKNVVEQACKGDWILGTGGANRGKSAGHGKLIYAMRVDEKLTRKQYYDDSRFARKRLHKTHPRTRGDNERPNNDFERHEQFALISWRFYYFGRDAIEIPQEFLGIEKKGPGFRCDFDPEYVSRFVQWLEAQRDTPGKYGEPCDRREDTLTRGKACKSSC